MTNFTNGFYIVLITSALISPINEFKFAFVKKSIRVIRINF